jgi:hypothetical protein
LDCPIGGDCPHFFDIKKWEGMYWRIFKEAEHEDGYVRDACVFSDRHTINDHETASIRFESGALVNFSLCAFAPHQHSYINITGTTGRLEMCRGSDILKWWRGDSELEEFDFASEHVEHGHGGTDGKMLADLIGVRPSDPLLRADPLEARRAVLIADLAARSIAAGGRPVSAEEAGRDYPPAPPQT